MIKPFNRLWPFKLNNLVVAVRKNFSPLNLFANGEQGWWYDPSNFSTLFQDSAGTTPVTAVEQPVGLQLDLSKGGVGSNGAARYNLLTKTEQFDNAAWTKTDATVTANAATAPDGTTTADLLIETAATGNHRVSQTAGTLQAQTLMVSISHKAGVGTRNLDFAIVGGGNFVSSVFSTATGEVLANNDFAGIIFSGKQNTVSGPDAQGFYTATITVNLLSAQSVSVVYGLANGTSNNYTGNGTSGIYIWGADLRLASQAALTPTYQPIDTTWTASIPGNHRFQTTSANRPVVSARVNLLERTEDFTSAYWTKDNCTVTGNTTIAPDGTATGDTCTVNTVAGARYVRRSSTLAAGSYTFTRVFKYSGSQQYVSLTLYDTTYKGCVFDVQNGTVTFSQSATGSVVSLGNGWYRCTIVATVAAGTVFYDVNLTNSSTAIAPSYLGNGTDNVFIWGADLRPTNQGVGLPAYQRVNTSTDYDSTGFPVYIKPNGSNQFMVTNSINFTATDKMTVWQGVRKLSDTGIGFVTELSANGDANTGSFGFAAPVNSSTYYFSLRGTTLSCRQPTTPINAPVTSVIAANYKLSETSANEMMVRFNANAIALSTASGLPGPAGTGNFGTYPAYFYMRAGTSLPFNGNDYGSIARGAASTAAQIEAAESWMNSKTKAY